MATVDYNEYTLAVECPICYAAVRNRCKNLSSASTKALKPHSRRVIMGQRKRANDERAARFAESIEQRRRDLGLFALPKLGDFGGGELVPADVLLAYLETLEKDHYAMWGVLQDFADLLDDIHTRRRITLQDIIDYSRTTLENLLVQP